MDCDIDNKHSVIEEMRNSYNELMEVNKQLKVLDSGIAREKLLELYISLIKRYYDNKIKFLTSRHGELYLAGKTGVYAGNRLADMLDGLLAVELGELDESEIPM